MNIFHEHVPAKVSYLAIIISFVLSGSVMGLAVEKSVLQANPPQGQASAIQALDRSAQLAQEIPEVTQVPTEELPQITPTPDTCDMLLSEKNQATKKTQTALLNVIKSETPQRIATFCDAYWYSLLPSTKKITTQCKDNASYSATIKSQNATVKEAEFLAETHCPNG